MSAASGSADAVELRGVSKRFGDTVALHRIDLAIHKGEFFSLLGPSGCGKTTTLNLIGGFESATTGTLLIDGQPVQGVPPHRRPVNTVFQNYALFPHMSVADNVGFGLRMKRVPPAERERAVAEMLALVSLEGYGARRPAQLSGGQRQRVALARALVNRPSVLLLDEPLGALDLKLRKQMQQELTRIQRQVGITFVYVTHDQEEALAMSDRIAVMDHGRLLQVGTPAEIYDAPADRAVMEFIGTANVFEGRVAPGGAGQVLLDDLGPMPAAGAAQLPPRSRVALLVRPERLQVATVAPGPEVPVLGGRVVKVTALGFVTHCSIRLDNGAEVLAYRLSREGGADPDRPAVQQRVFVWWSATDARSFPSDPLPPPDGAIHPPVALAGD